MKGKIIFNKRLGGSYHYMKIESPEFVSEVKPGNFLMVKANPFENCVDPLLRRPFGVCDVEGNCFTILYSVVGKGTKVLSEFKSGEFISFSKPLGNCFFVDKGKKVALIAGGVGIAPLLFLSKELKKNDNEIYLFYGGKTKDDIHLIDKFEEYCDKVYIATEDGTMGKKGFVTDLIKDKFDFYYSCGPKPMMKKCVEIALKDNIPIEVSLDERMACGMGACLGCIVYLKQDDDILQKRCCVEGPVFDGKKIAWELL